MRATMENHLRGFADVKLRGEYCRDAVQPSFDFSDTTPEHGTLLPGRLEIGSPREPRPMGWSSLAQDGTPTG